MANFIQHYAPLYYSQINAIDGCYTPSMVKSLNNQIFQLWERALFQRAASVIEFDNMPEKWSGGVFDFFLYCLYRNGFVGVTDKVEDRGLIFQPGSLSGYNIYYQPTQFLFSNPVLRGSKNLTIGEDCELIKQAGKSRFHRQCRTHHGHAPELGGALAGKGVHRAPGAFRPSCCPSRLSPLTLGS